MNTHKPLTIDEYKAIYSCVPRLTVEVLLKSTDGVLLTYRAINPHRNTWHIPGGTVYFKEPVHEAVKRVAKEELGITVSVQSLLGYIEYPDEELFLGFDYPIGLAFLCESVSSEIILNEQSSKWAYFTQSPEPIVPVQQQFLQSHALLTI